MYEVQRRYERDAHLDLALAPLSVIGQVLGKLERAFEAGDGLAGCGPFLGSGGCYD